MAACVMCTIDLYRPIVGASRGPGRPTIVAPRASWEVGYSRYIGKPLLPAAADFASGIRLIKIRPEDKKRNDHLLSGSKQSTETFARPSLQPGGLDFLR
jgi:hypothetical protein